jgi:hypothetical protein
MAKVLGGRKVAHRTGHPESDKENNRRYPDLYRHRCCFGPDHRISSMGMGADAHPLAPRGHSLGDGGAGITTRAFSS